MTDDQIKNWKVERDIARGIHDPEERRIALEKVYDHRDEMQMTCIAHQSVRVKSLQANMAEVKRDIMPLKKTCNEIETKKIEARGALKFAGILSTIAKIGGGALLYKIIQALGSVNV